MNRSYLSDLEQLLLLSVLRLGGDAYGGAIRTDLIEMAGRSVAVATIYVALSRLEDRGFVRSWLADPTPVRGGKAKRYYAVEPAGSEALSEARDVMDRMWNSIPSPESGAG